MIKILRTLVLFLMVLCLTITFICIYVYIIYTPYSFQTKAVAQSEIVSPILSPVPTVFKMQSLFPLINNELENSIGTYAIAVVDLNNNDKYLFNEHQIFQTASLYKLWVMAETYQQLDSNKFKNTTILSDNIENLNKKFAIASESAERSEGSISMSVEEALTKMITYSDNYSALLLSSKIGLKNVKDFLLKNNFIESKIGTTLPVTSANDIMKFYEMLYRNQLGNYSTQMINLLKQQKIKRKIPKYIPSNVTIAHKTGELDSYSHDAGIVYTTKGDYILVILSKSNNPKAAEEKISKISETVYKFMTQDNY